MADNRLIIFDTTLRDGEQSPGASMNLAEKLEIAHALKDLGVDIIEAGFPIASPGDFEAVQAIARAGRRARSSAAWPAATPPTSTAPARRSRTRRQPRIHVFLATSAIHREFKLQMAKDEIVRRAVEGVKRAKGYCDDVEFSPEDAARTELDFLAEVVEKAIEAGATTINIPDTVGYAVPEQYAAAIRHLKQNVRGIDKVVISVHCHNDLGLAVANSLAALQEGARQVECTINGIGERAGNCALEEIVMAVKTRGDYFGLDDRHQHASGSYPTSRLVSHVTGIAGAAQQGHRRPERLRPRGRHPPGRHAQGAHDLRDHEARGRRPAADRAGAGQALAAGTPCGSASATWAITSTTSSCRRSSTRSRCWPTARRRSTTPTSRRWPRPQIHTGPALWTLEAFTCNAGSGTIPSAAVVPVAPGRHDPPRRRRSATARSTPSSRPSSASPASTSTLRDYRVRSVTVGEDAQGEAHGRGRVQRPHAARPGRQHRHHRGQRPGVPAGRSTAALLREQLKMNPQTEAVLVS